MCRTLRLARAMMRTMCRERPRPDGGQLLYMLIRFEQLPQIIAYSDIIYMILSAVIVILNVLLLIKNKKLKTQKCEAIGE